MGKLNYYLLIYRPASQVLTVREFDSASEAGAALTEAELEFRHTDEVQTVLLTAESEAVIRQTHPHYFAASNPATDDEYAVV